MASGKSFVGRALADLGCYLIEADKLGHQVLLPGGEAYDAVVREFGPNILDPEGRIDRRKLGAHGVRHNPERLEKLNRLGPSAGAASARQAHDGRDRPARSAGHRSCGGGNSG